jgi:hypothetical protein
MAKKESALIKCENKGGTWFNGKCVVPKKPKPIEQLKIKIKL